MVKIRRLAAAIAFFLPALAQAPASAVVFQVDAFPNYKSVAIGGAHCGFWSHLANAVYSLEAACYASATAKPEIAVYNLNEIGVGGFGYCEDGNVLPPPDVGARPFPMCNEGVAGGSFLWVFQPSATAGMTVYRITATPLGGYGAEKDGTF